MKRFAAVAADFDGTLVSGTPHPSEEVLRVLDEARKRVKLILVTGRVISTVDKNLLAKFDAVVAENGALVETSGRRYAFFPDKEWGRLCSVLEKRIADPTAEVGEVILSFDRSVTSEVEHALSSEGLESIARLEFNRDRVMVLPRGVDKGFGLSRACEAMAIDPREVACIGDAENDLPLFEVAGFCAAVANALPELKARADYVCQNPNGRGVVEFFQRFVLKQ